MAENWRAVKGFEGCYEVSDYGRVRSLSRQCWQSASRHCDAHWRTLQGRILRPGRYTPQGHLSLPLGRGTNGMPVHGLVMEAFVGPVPPGKEVLHGDGNPANNHLINLRYGTRRENNLDISIHDRRKLTREQVRSIRKKRTEGALLKNLAQEFGVCQSQVHNVVKGRHYAHVS